MLANIGLTWYARLESGEPINASGDVLQSLASALRLTGVERDVLMSLAGKTSAAAAGESPEVNDIKGLIDDFRSPAFAMSGPWNVIYWNWAFAQAWLIGAPGSAGFNAVEYHFTIARDREMHADWEAAAGTMVDQFRADYLLNAGDPAYETLLSRLLEIKEFAVRFNNAGMMTPSESVAGEIRHPQLGRIAYVAKTVTLPASEVTITVQLVDDDVKEQLLHSS